MEYSVQYPHIGDAEEDYLLFDMKDVTYIEVPAIIFMIAFIYKNQSDGKEIKIKLPEHLTVRNLIRYFRLPDVLLTLTGKKFRDIVMPENWRYFGEHPYIKEDYRSFQKKIYSKYDSFADAIADKNIHVYSDLYRFKTDIEKINSCENLLTDWNCSAMKAFLTTYLESEDNNKERLVPNRIIYEGITNSQRHSKADWLMVAFMVKKEGKGGIDEKFDISFWDNGDSIIKTLKDTLAEGRIIRNEDFPMDTIQASFYVKYDNNKFNKKTIDSDTDVDEFKDDNGLLLLSSFFPGISEFPQRDDGFSGNPDLPEGSPFKNPGMGLTILLNAAIDLLGGEVSVRAENYFLHIKKPENKTVKIYEAEKVKYGKLYEVKIENCGEDILGNMLTIRLPLKEK
jgi:hypothetical protein